MRTQIQQLVESIQAYPACVVLPPAGEPVPLQGHILPADVVVFYRLCGGIGLFEKEEYPSLILPPHRVLPANPIIVGADVSEDISCSWYTIGDMGNGNYITIDFAPNRLGRCYDSAWDCHAVAGSCPVVALSFTELLQSLVVNKGGYWYWLREGFPALGDAYDGERV